MIKKWDLIEQAILDRLEYYEGEGYNRFLACEVIYHDLSYIAKELGVSKPNVLRVYKDVFHIVK